MGILVWLILFLLYWLLCFGAMVWFLYKRCWPKPSPKISFFITDLWGVVVGLTPTFLFIKYAAKDHSEEFSAYILSVLIAAISQLFGAVAGWIISFDQTANWTFGRYDRTLWILFGEIILAPAILAVVLLTFYVMGLLAGSFFGWPQF